MWVPKTEKKNTEVPQDIELVQDLLYGDSRSSSHMWDRSCFWSVQFPTAFAFFQRSIDLFLCLCPKFLLKFLV